MHSFTTARRSLGDKLLACLSWPLLRDSAVSGLLAVLTAHVNMKEKTKLLAPDRGP